MLRAWDVDWVDSYPGPEDEPDLDNPVSRCRRFSNREAAREFARHTAAPESYWGTATVREVREISRAELEADDDLEWWIEPGRLMAFVGEAEEVAAG